MAARTATTIRTEALPEFLRSRAVGAVIAEALDHQVHERGTGSIASLGEMILAAAREIRDFHGLPVPSHQQGTAPRLVTSEDDGHRDMDTWTRTEPEADQG